MGTEPWVKVKGRIFKIWHFYFGTLSDDTKEELLPNGFPWIYQLDCNYNALYIDDTKKKIINRTIEHQLGKAQVQLSFV